MGKNYYVRLILIAPAIFMIVLFRGMSGYQEGNIESEYKSNCGTNSIAVASYWIIEQLQSYGYTDAELDSFLAIIDSDSLNLWNVVATEEGYGDSSRHVVIGGYYPNSISTLTSSFHPFTIFLSENILDPNPGATLAQR